MCFDCVVKMESEIKCSGKWKEYEEGIMNANRNASLTDLETALEDWLLESSTFVTEAGEVESWKGGDKKAIYTQVKERIAELKKADIYKQNNTE